MPVLTQGRYTDACKTEAVRLVSESGRPVAQIARELSIPDHVRYRWVSGQRHAQAQGTRPESMCGCARNEIVYDGRRRASRASLHEIPIDAPGRYPCQDRTRSGVPPPSPIIGSPILSLPFKNPESVWARLALTGIRNTDGATKKVFRFPGLRVSDCHNGHGTNRIGFSIDVCTEGVVIIVSHVNSRSKFTP